MKRRTVRAVARKAKKSSKHVPATSKYAEKKKARLELSPAEIDLESRKQGGIL